MPRVLPEPLELVSLELLDLWVSQVPLVQQDHKDHPGVPQAQQVPQVLLALPVNQEYSQA